jgi:hypothetical protein
MGRPTYGKTKRLTSHLREARLLAEDMGMSLSIVLINRVPRDLFDLIPAVERAGPGDTAGYAASWSKTVDGVTWTTTEPPTYPQPAEGVQA